MTARHRTVRRLAVAVVLTLLAPLLVAVAGPASPTAAAVTGPSPIPADLWNTDPGLPLSQSWVVLDGAVGDKLTNGNDKLYTSADSEIGANFGDNGVYVTVLGDEHWDGWFEPMAGLAHPAVGYYPGVKAWTPYDSSKGGMRWFSAETSCVAGGDYNPTGWFTVDEIRVDAKGELAGLTVRFGQTCTGGTELRGKVHWVAGDLTPPVGPVVPVPSGLWDSNPGVGPHQSYFLLDSSPGETQLDGADQLYTKANSQISLSEADSALSVQVLSDRNWVALFTPMASLTAVQPGYYQIPYTGWWGPNPFRGALSLSPCFPGGGWFAVDQVGRSSGSITSLTIRFAVFCGGGDVPLYGKIHWDAADPTVASGLPTAIPGGLWDVSAPVGSGLSYAVFDSEVGDPIANGTDGSFSRVGSRIAVSENQGVLDVQVDESATWRGRFATVPGVPLATGYYGAPDPLPASNPTSSAMSFARGPYGTSPTACTMNDGWFAIDQLTRTSGQITSLTLRFDITCDGLHHLKGKVRWLTSDTTTGRVTPVPGGLWDVTPQGVTGNYTYIDGVAGDLVTGGADVVLQDPQHPGIPSDYQGGIASIIGTGNPQDFWVAEFDGVDDQGKVQSGYYPNLSSVTSPNPVLGGVRVTHLTQSGKSCTPGTTTGWFAVDHLGRIDGQINRLELRFEQSCDGAPPMHGRLHYDLGGLEVGPPIGAFESAVPVTGGVKVDGWALDPETASAIGVDVLVDGVVTTTLTASGNRPDVGTANPLYGNGHGFSANVGVPVGTHQVCTRARNTGVGTDTTLGCRTVKVGTGSPFGSVDQVKAAPGAIVTSGWAIDPDTSTPIAVHAYVDTMGTALTADGSRPDVAAAFQGYGPAHGYSATLPASPGAHQVCLYGINVGGGSNSVLGCRTVTVPGGPPIGSLDLVTAGPGVVTAAGWALDPDTSASIPVHVYVDNVGVAVMASGSRPDVGAFFQGYGSAHGFSAQVSIGPGVHTVCAYGINVGVGATSTLGCRTVVVPGGSPFGSLDVVTGGAGQVTVGGWAIDPDTAASIPVHVYVGPAGTALTAGGTRNDVAAAFTGYGPAHGYGAVIPASAGAKQVCAYAINVGVGGNTLLGCRTVSVS